VNQHTHSDEAGEQLPPPTRDLDRMVNGHLARMVENWGLLFSDGTPFSPRVVKKMDRRKTCSWYDVARSTKRLCVGTTGQQSVLRWLLDLAIAAAVSECGIEPWACDYAAS
jgi:hypothetical protein